MIGIDLFSLIVIGALGISGLFNEEYIMGSFLSRLLPLSIGLITTLFSAYFISRHLTSIIVFKNKEKKILI